MSGASPAASTVIECDDCQDDPIANMVDGYCPSCGEGRCLPCGGTGKIESEFGDTGRAYRCDFCELRSPKKVRAAERAWKDRQHALQLAAMKPVFAMPSLAACPCGYSNTAHAPTSAEWHRGHRDVHVAKFPNVPAATLDSLNLFVSLAERGAFLGPTVVVS